MRLNVVIGLLGLIAGLLIAMAAGTGGQPVFAQGAAPGGSMMAVAANFNNQQEDIVYVFDARAKRLACYKYKGNLIEFIGARNIMFDLQIKGEYVHQPGRHLTPTAVKRVIDQQSKEKPPRKGG